MLANSSHRKQVFALWPSLCFQAGLIITSCYLATKNLITTGGILGHLLVLLVGLACGIQAGYFLMRHNTVRPTYLVVIINSSWRRLAWLIFCAFNVVLGGWLTTVCYRKIGDQTFLLALLASALLAAVAYRLNQPRKPNRIVF